jgi:hypothetical protein
MMLQTHFSQAQPLQPGDWCGWHICAQVPQSFEQFWQFSPWFTWQTPFPQLQGPQSAGQLEQVSVGASHFLLPQTAHAPQSFGQVAQLSP